MAIVSEPVKLTTMYITSGISCLQNKRCSRFLSFQENKVFLHFTSALTELSHTHLVVHTDCSRLIWNMSPRQCVVVFENMCLLVCVLLTCISADVYVLCSSGQQFAQQMQQQNPELIEQLRSQIRNRTPSSSNDEQP